MYDSCSTQRLQSSRNLTMQYMKNMENMEITRKLILYIVIAQDDVVMIMKDGCEIIIVEKRVSHRPGESLLTDTIVSLKLFIN